MSYYPIFVDLRKKSVLIVGGGEVAQRKIETLLEYDAYPRVVSKALTPLLEKLVKDGRITYLGREFSEEQLNDTFMVMAATDDAALNRKVSALAQERGLLINAVDQPVDCNFIVPSILRRGDLTIAVSTSGKSPALAKKVRHDLEKKFGPEYGDILNLMGSLRKEILSRGLTQKENKRIFEELVDSELFNGITERKWDKVESILNRILGKRFSTEDIIQYLKGE